jgi:hypothetical protein
MGLRRIQHLGEAGLGGVMRRVILVRGFFVGGGAGRSLVGVAGAGRLRSVGGILDGFMMWACLFESFRDGGSNVVASRFDEVV